VLVSSLAEKIPLMSDADLSALRINAQRLVQHGLLPQIVAASDILPLIEAETDRRAAIPKPQAVKTARASRRRKPAPVSGHQTALPSLSKDP
jgi:hypothetical protein